MVHDAIHENLPKGLFQPINGNIQDGRTQDGRLTANFEVVSLEWSIIFSVEKGKLFLSQG